MTPEEKYIRDHSTAETDALKWVDRETHLKTIYPQMLSGPVQGRLLTMNDELEDIIREGWARAGVSEKITLHIGDAKETLKSLEGPYDLVFMDANKREYCDYFELVMPLLRKGGIILADDILWDGKLFENPVPKDAQTQGIARFNEMVAEDKRVEVVILPLRDGLSIIRKK